MTISDMRQAIQGCGLIASRRLVLLGLVELVGESDGCKLALHRLCEVAGLPDRTVRRSLAELAALGVVSIQDGVRPGRRDGLIRGHSSYRLDLSALVGQLRLSRAAIVERLNAAWARNQVRLARRAAWLSRFRSGNQRPVTLADADRDRDILLSSAAPKWLSERELDAKIARERAVWAEIARMDPAEAAAAMERML